MATQEGYFRPATDEEIKEAVVLILLLPSREPDDASNRDALRAMYRSAIGDVPGMALGESIMKINRGGLGHAFRPSPPELRMFIDKVMEPRITARRMAEREIEQERQSAEEERQKELIGADLPATSIDIDIQIARLVKATTKAKSSRR